MENPKFVSKDAALRLPPGFRFHPTDEELVLQYLKRKVLSSPMPASVILEVDACKSDPWDLPGDLKQERYFFGTRKAKYPNGNRSNRATASGYWKATGTDKQIITPKGNQVVGMKKTLVFYRGKPPHGARTNWIMHEYRLLAAEKDSIQSPIVPVENWVLCRIFLKKRNDKKENEDIESGDNNSERKPRNRRPTVFYDFLAKKGTNLNLAPAVSSSGSSGVTEMSRNESDDRDESSSCNSRAPLPCVTRKP